MTSIKKAAIHFLVFCLVITFSSCNDSEVKKDDAKVEGSASTNDTMQTAPLAFTPFKIMIVKHAVANFDKWRTVYLAHDSMRMAYGITHYRFGRGMDDSNMVVVFDKVADIQKAKDFAMLPNLKDAMQKAGVKGKPDFSNADVVWNDDSPIDQTERVLVSHTVKDFDAWKKVFDAEGKTKRLENGLIDRGLARGVEDPNMVYIVFAVSDMAKAKARINSEELRKLMTDAGVTGPPQIFFYKLAE